MSSSNYDTQHELLKIALEATDNYLSVVKLARNSKIVTQPMLHDYSYYMARAYDALRLLGVLDQHQDYISKFSNEMIELSNHDDETIADLPFMHSPSVGNVEQNESVSYPISFKEYFEESDKHFNDNEIEDMIANLHWDDIYDMYDPEDLLYDESEDEEDEDDDKKKEIEEKISAQSRLKRGQGMARRSGRLTLSRNLKLKRTSTMEGLKKRAISAARRSLYKKLLMGRDKSQLSPAEKDRLEQRMSGLKYLQATIAIKMMPRIKSIEQKRLAHKRKR